MSVNGNGHDDEETEDGKRVIRFPDLAERDRLRREKEEAEKQDNKKPGSDAPFINLSRIPPLTRYMIAAFLVIHLVLFLLLDAATRLQIFYTLGFVPAIYTGATAWSWLGVITPVTHMFIHGGWFHILMNVTMMLAMGMFMETAFGTRRMMIFFLFSGLCGALFYFAFAPFSDTPVIGASGGISGLFAVTILALYEQGRLGSGSRRGPLPLLLFWVALTIGIGLIGGGIAWQAHLGGFLGALALFYALRRRWISF